MSSESSRYAEAGVDIDLAGKLLSEVKDKIKDTKRPEVLAPVGGFGGLFQLDLTRYKEPVMVASVDGVGTKLIVAEMMNKHDTVGYDIVNHSVNDIIVQGAEPLYFLDYLGIGKLRSPLFEDVVGGLADACKAQGITLLGGETAEMPGIYGGDYDLVGSITGVVEKSRLITGATIKEGHAIIGLASNGLHTNGYSLARKVLFEEAGFKAEDKREELDNDVLGEVLLKPHVCYWKAIRNAIDEDIVIDGMAHITGGGFYDNVPRILPDSLDAVFDKDVMPVLDIFKLIQDKGSISEREMYRVFNMGVGYMVFVDEADVKKTLDSFTSSGYPSAKIGTITSGSGIVKINGIDS
ncbi:MAG: phosphoribosylformylglycinamidine cyclo-ligase [Lentisphaeria bacterium]|nr:phosphoribosylformylglycinamidine cyclo-ligase [Lentisphaeria bacterium]NQZ68959.1 phosphoribosylformylglycinamidine cyclo-ligase [Lentisphaeria bacterium]